MKFFKAIAAITLFVTSSLAQSIEIGAPLSGDSITGGSSIVVEVDRPNSLSSSTEVAIVIALQSCPVAACHSPSEFLGSILYTGPYSPQYQNVPGHKPPHQNFTVVVPETFAKGWAQLSVTHLSLIGAAPAPFLEFQNITLNIV